MGGDTRNVTKHSLINISLNITCPQRQHVRVQLHGQVLYNIFCYGRSHYLVL